MKQIMEDWLNFLSAIVRICCQFDCAINLLALLLPVPNHFKSHLPVRYAYEVINKAFNWSIFLIVFTWILSGDKLWIDQFFCNGNVTFMSYLYFLLYLFPYMHLCLCMHICTCAYICICAHVRIYAYVHMCIYHVCV